MTRDELISALQAIPLNDEVFVWEEDGWCPVIAVERLVWCPRIQIQTKYTSEAMILKDIAKARRRFDRLRAKAVECDKTAEEMKLAGNESQFKGFQDEATRLRAQASRLENTRLVKLKHALSAFQTMPLFGERQVVLESVK
jgi:hypothetical protein